MAEEQDQADRTEEPSQKRLDDARDRGQVVQSREVGTALLLAAAALLFTVAAAPSAMVAARAWAGFLKAGGLPSHHAKALMPELLLPLLSGLWPILALLVFFMVAGALGTVIQGALVWTAEPLTPKLERISPLAGAKRLFSPDSLVELLKSLIKVGFVGAVLWGVLHAHAAEIVAVARLPIASGLQVLLQLLGLGLGAAAGATALLAALDWFWQRHRHIARLRMTREEVRQEHKESDGDPIIKQRLRQLRQERARRRMMAEVPKSTVVITNPTHVAVALRYDPGMAAPVVVAKGYDSVALAIRKRAREAGVPVVENVSLARALATVGVLDRPIPVDHYRAVAEIIAFVSRARRPA